MRVRDRLIVAVVAAVVVVGAFWVLVVSPERSKVADLNTQIAAEKATLANAQAALASARTTAAGYVGDVHAISEVMTAVPPRVSEPALVTQIAKLAGTPVDFHALDVGGQSTDAGGLNALGLTFTFNSTYRSLQDLITALDRLAVTDGTNVSATGRLVTVDAISLVPVPPDQETATVTARVYSQTAIPTGVTGATGPAATTTSSATP
jgi:hypothetical protein